MKDILIGALELGGIENGCQAQMCEIGGSRKALERPLTRADSNNLYFTGLTLSDRKLILSNSRKFCKLNMIQMDDPTFLTIFESNYSDIVHFVELLSLLSKYFHLSNSALAQSSPQDQRKNYLIIHVLSRYLSATKKIFKIEYESIIGVWNFHWKLESKNLK